MDIRSRRRAGMSTWEDDAAGQVQSACAAAGFRRNRRCGRAAPRPAHGIAAAGKAQLRFEESPPVVRLAEVAPGVEHLQAAVALQGEGREASGAETVHQPPTVGEVRAQRLAGAGVERLGEALAKPQFGTQLEQHRTLGDTPALDVVGTLDPRQHRRAEAVERFGGKHGGGRRGRVEYRAGVAQQAVEVVLAERLAGQLGDPQVMGHHVVAQAGADRLAVGIGHHAAAMQAYVQTRHLAGGGEQRRGAVAPAAERIVEVMQGEVVHLGLHETPRRGRLDQRLSAGAAQGHCISPLSTLALSSRPSSPGRFG